MGTEVLTYNRADGNITWELPAATGTQIDSLNDVADVNVGRVAAYNFAIDAGGNSVTTGFQIETVSVFTFPNRIVG